MTYTRVVDIKTLFHLHEGEVRVDACTSSRAPASIPPKQAEFKFESLRMPAWLQLG